VIIDFTHLRASRSRATLRLPKIINENRRCWMAKVIVVTLGKSDTGITKSTGALGAALAQQGGIVVSQRRQKLPAGEGEGEAAAKRL
jgi:hypothetical protein